MSDTEKHCLSVTLKTLSNKCTVVECFNLSDLNNFPKKVMKSSITHTHQPEYEFREWHYVTAEVCFELDNKAHSICFDTSCSVTLIDREFLNKVASNTEICHSESVNVNRIAGSEITYKYTLLDLWIPGIVKTHSGLKKRAVDWLNQKTQVINDLKAKLLMGTDILDLKQIDLLFTTDKMIIHSCSDLIVSINTATHAIQQVKRTVQIKRKMIIEFYTLIKVSICLWKLTDLLNRTLMFQSEYHSTTQQLAERDEAIYAHIIDSNIVFIQIWNDSDKLITFRHHAHLSYITECLEKDCYMMSSEAHSLISKILTKIHWSFWVWKTLMTVSLISDIA